MKDDPQRPDPDALLERLADEQARNARARFRIFFGFAPGVGKTFAMLEAAQKLRAQGVDVVVGCVETHGREETRALLEGLEVLPRREVAYRGTVLHEFDLEAAIARKPAVLLLDELAHSNAPGLAHPYRHQDALDLLEAGIEVYSTLNVQHVESLNDVVAQITSVRVRETVPDALLDRADQLELVDLTPDALLARLREGKVYLPEQAARAAENFFRRGNLLALRELALRRTADRVDAEVQAWREQHDIEQSWPAAERILVCVGPSPASARLLRIARRMAAGLRAPWTAAYVEATTAPALTPADQQRLDAHLHLAETLGAEVVHLSGPRVSAVLLEYARKHNVTRLILGKPTHSRLRDLLRGSLLDEVVRGSGELEVHVSSGDPAPAPQDRAERAERGSQRQGFVWAIALVSLATAVSWLGRSVLALPDLVMLYQLGIMLVAVRFGRGPSVLAAALSVAAYDFFFVPPRFTFAVSDARHVLTFGVMFGVGLLLSGLTLRVRRGEQRARRREARTAALYALSRELGAALDDVHAASILSRHASAALQTDAAVLLTGARGSLEAAPHSGSVPLGPDELAVARWSLEHQRPAGADTDTLPGARIVCFPLRSGPHALGVLALTPPASGALDLDARAMLETLVRQGALAVERARLAEQAHTAALRAQTEELRSTLLSAVSHDLRTPLAAITGAGTALRDDAEALAPALRAELLDTVCEEAERLERLVANLLDMTRLEAGGVRLARDWVPLDELVGSALARTEKLLAGRAVTVTLSPAVPLLSVDPVLFGQVLVNLLENAARYTLAGTPVEILGALRDGRVVLEVRDEGPGLAPGTEERVFEKFYRGVRGAGGVGLGLAICRGIVEAHGGTIRAENRGDGAGAVFRVALPLPEQAPSVPP